MLEQQIEESEKSLYDRLGRLKALEIALRATPMREMGCMVKNGFYGVRKYCGLLKESKTFDELDSKHQALWSTDHRYWKAKPRNTKASSMIRKQLRSNVYEKIDFRGLIKAVWKSTPWYAKLTYFPLSALLFRKTLKQSKDISEIDSIHKDRCRTNRLYRAFRPEWRLAEKVLASYDLN